MISFGPTIITEDAKYLEYIHGKKYNTGDKYGIADVVFADDTVVEICYERGSNCLICPKECPFNKNTNRKEG